MEKRPMQEGEETAVVALWDAAGLIRPWNDPLTDICFARNAANAEILVGLEDGALVASVLVGHDGHRGAVYFVSSDPDKRGCGYGRAIMQAAEDWLVARGVWKLNLMIRVENETVHGFYKSWGYRDEQRFVMSKRLSSH